MTFDDYVRSIQEKYQCTEKDAIEVLGLYKYKQAIKKYEQSMERGEDKCMINVRR
jgi:hypothetical protein